MMTRVRAVLFDLDGTLLDTVPDFVYALNQLRKELNLPALSNEDIRPIASVGSKSMVKYALGLEENHIAFNSFREKFLTIYHDHIADATRFFPDMENVLAFLEEQQIPWGIVTNKLTKHTLHLLKTLQIDHRPACVVCGDSLPTYKPDPRPILHACELLKLNPSDCIYVGDAQTDVTASKGAGMKSLVALYGYIGENENPYTWQADGYIQTPKEILKWV